jgi:Arc/MetJ-type ribon-helix-helix transcriptional regulator
MRTQRVKVTLPEKERAIVREVARRAKKSESEVIRVAIQLLAKTYKITVQAPDQVTAPASRAFLNDTSTPMATN